MFIGMTDGHRHRQYFVEAAPEPRGERRATHQYFTSLDIVNRLAG
jgi:hypothetical protein